MTLFTTKIIWVDGKATVTLTPEIMQAWGAKEGDYYELSVEGREVIVRLLTESELEAKIQVVSDDVFARRQSAYEKLAEGVK